MEEGTNLGELSEEKGVGGYEEEEEEVDVDWVGDAEFQFEVVELEGMNLRAKTKVEQCKDESSLEILSVNDVMTTR